MWGVITYSFPNFNGAPDSSQYSSVVFCVCVRGMTKLTKGKNNRVSIRLLPCGETANRKATRAWASIHDAGGRLTVRSRKVLKLRDSGSDFSNRPEI